MSREVSLRLTPTFALNHCRFSSTSEMRAIGASQIRAASSVRSSKTSSGTVSSTSYCQSTLRRFFSFSGIGAGMVFICSRWRKDTDSSAESNVSYSELSTGLHRIAVHVLIVDTAGGRLPHRHKPLRAIRCRPDHVAGLHGMPILFQTIDALTPQDHQAAFHDRRFDGGHRGAGGAGGKGHGHVEARMAGQERLQARVLVAAQGLALNFAFVRRKARGPRDARQRLIWLLKYQEPCRWRPTGNLNVLAGGEVGIAAGLEAMLARVHQDARRAFEHVNKILVHARIARAFAVSF